MHNHDETDAIGATVEQRYRWMLQNVTDVVYVIGPSHLITWISSNIESTLGWVSAELVHTSILALVHPDDQESVQKFRREVIAGTMVDASLNGFSCRLRSKSGEYLWMRFRTTTKRDATGEFTYAVVGLRNVDEVTKIQMLLKESEMRYRLVAEHSSDAILLSDLQLNILWASPSSSKLLGTNCDALVGTNARDYIHADDFPEIVRLVAESEKQQIQIHPRFRWRGMSGIEIRVEASSAPASDLGMGTPVRVVTIRDIDEQVLVERELNRRAKYDDLTGVFQRDEAMVRLALATHHVRRTGEETGVLFCDIDAFKSTNEKFGHSGGDDVLVEVARRITHAVRAADTVARMGGDEFLVVLDGVHHLYEAGEIAEKIRSAVSVPVVSGGVEIPISISIGVTLSGKDEAIDSMIERADKAMFQAKNAGRAQVVVIPVG